MNTVREYTQNSIRSFIKGQRLKLGKRPEEKLGRFTFAELETRAEKIPCCELWPLLETLNSDDLLNWWFKFQMEIYKIKTKGVVC